MVLTSGVVTSGVEKYTYYVNIGLSRRSDNGNKWKSLPQDPIRNASTMRVLALRT